ncbi:DUF4297 domain-containing protein [Marinimicrobium sp. C6131]|uniref:dsDNA nuclease domain-containing protein n=1 Tax=Marinimicrobium sp. C6131 TaxID=3022676 RepID=UPI00223C948D|nr:dsDNA nuclease domain-containing protein [Marinimicrobium sp. C6131]UZJ42919.1 DUF4297 domain-containing protein [Marinimicrobium sp. C6131]
MDSPLADQQREKKGAETFSKYEYQYHWAFKKLLDAHDKKKEYAIFVELHEDVVFANSLEKETAEFEFYQVKENSGSSKHTVASLTKVHSGSNNSVLGKLIESYHGKTFKGVISSANLVATSGFSSAMVKNGLALEEITTTDLKLKTLATFKKKVLEELKLDECPVNIRFIVPKLLPNSQRESVIASIVDLISSAYPNSQCDAVNIYRVLIDELHRKGQVKYDYSKWDSLLKEKALTSITVQNTIDAHSSIKGLDEVEKMASDLISDLKIKFSQRQSLLRSVKSYYTRSISRSSNLYIRFREEVNKIYYQYQHFDTEDTIREIEQALTENLKKHLKDEISLRAAIICEIVLSEI